MALTKDLGGEGIDEAPEIDELNCVVERAVEVIGDRDTAYRWLGSRFGRLRMRHRSPFAQPRKAGAKSSWC